MNKKNNKEYHIKEGKVVDIIERNDDNMMNVGDFQKLLDIYYVTQ